MKNIGVLLVIQIITSAGFGAEYSSSHNSAGCKEFKTDQVTLTVEIASNIYTYRLLNLDSTAIVGIEIPQHASYNFKAPQSWETKDTGKSFHAWTDNSSDAIPPNATVEFSLRVSSAGAVLGQKPVKIYFKSGQVINVEDVWVSVAEPRSYILLVMSMILAIVILHSIIVVRKNRRKSKDSLNAV